MLTGVLRFHLAMYGVAVMTETMITRTIISSGVNKGMTVPPITTGVSFMPVGVCTVTCGALGLVWVLGVSTPMLGSCVNVPLPKYG